jgi:hypothetical protein
MCIVTDEVPPNPQNSIAEAQTINSKVEMQLTRVLYGLFLVPFSLATPIEQSLSPKDMVTSELLPNEYPENSTALSVPATSPNPAMQKRYIDLDLQECWGLDGISYSDWLNVS